MAIKTSAGADRENLPKRSRYHHSINTLLQRWRTNLAFPKQGNLGTSDFIERSR